MRVACVGEAMVELSLEASGQAAQVGFAGDTLNTAIYLKRAAPSLEVSYVTRLGRDAFSARLLAFIRAEQIDTDCVEISDARRVGLYAISTDAAGERSFTYWRETSAARQMFQKGAGCDFAALQDFDVVYLSAITLAILPERVRSEFYNWAGGFRGAGGRIAFDSNYRPALWTNSAVAKKEIGRWSKFADFALPSVDDEMQIYGENSVDDVASRWRDWGPRDGALKCGPGGPISLGEPVEAAYPAAATVVDTTAAGDSFNGGYLAARLTGAPQAEALMAGHNLAARVVGVKGAILPRG
ncbi:2-dehydro-3-deoxygluconate kinase [Candidatus Rhodobacter oscarellae]|uniref:2-dehydro-3-deoxygluconate kinase n=1 Tax=Candidatus Rhodobacter oscarellae TaxID=1675527 RepID=A0A0J9E0J7_9RHOB|nr:sugar kinase [Candidatus Rhodobacter lobularis]KMW56245.1 2-dehydro-3-deoxygluconate kinase [Candidatus Rhodobacter lobularis]